MQLSCIDILIYCRNSH